MTDLFHSIVEDAKSNQNETPDSTEFKFTEKRYDACLLYVDEDLEFVSTLIERVEKGMGFKLFVKYRDVELGSTIEMTSVLKVISGRCSHLIAIVSEAYIKNPMEKYYTDHAQQMAIKNKIVVIPCIIEECSEIPNWLGSIFSLKFKQNQISDNIEWDKLKNALGKKHDFRSISQ